ncbi:MAG: hypothetical protein HZB11_01940 [Candidatus Yonathbacteria bacterium]|nr:hypothetical protein [Candidatus Yonathbacteria bacterium]
MVTEEKEDVVKGAGWRGYLRKAEIAAVVFLLIIIAIVALFRGSTPITVTSEKYKITGSFSGNASALKQVETEQFVVTDMGKVEGSAKENISTANPKIFESPENFKSFTYDATVGKKIAIAGTCKDTYYTLLIFKSGDDYRKDPARAYYNTAFPCPASGIVTLSVNLKDFNLPSGNYYLFLADQGEKGSWYNPR